jgi:glyoxylase-like metal-dependent hydrolase (beta-lactamase superfamily II)
MLDPEEGNWMEVAKGVHRLTGGVVNFYLVEDGGRLTAIDAGTPRDWGVLGRAVSELGLALGDLEAVLLTHAHSDHTGFAERARTSGATVWIHGADAGLARGDKPPKNDGKVTSYLLKAEFYRTVFSLGRRGGTKIVPIKEVSEFADGETIDVPGSPRAVHAPGHTAGSCAILLEDRRSLITGDAMVTRNPLTGRRGPQIMPSAFNVDTGQALRSLDALGDVPADVLLPGHGEPWTDGPAEAVRAAKAAGPS